MKRPAGSAQERLLQHVLSIFVTARYTVRRAVHKLSTVSKYMSSYRCARSDVTTADILFLEYRNTAASGLLADKFLPHSPS